MRKKKLIALLGIIVIALVCFGFDAWANEAPEVDIGYRVVAFIPPNPQLPPPIGNAYWILRLEGNASDDGTLVNYEVLDGYDRIVAEGPINTGDSFTYVEWFQPMVGGREHSQRRLKVKDNYGVWGESDLITIAPPCFIATASYGSAMHEDVDTLRDFRDQHLMENAAGRKFVELYYEYSPPAAEFISDNPALSAVVRFLLKPLVWVSERITK